MIIVILLVLSAAIVVWGSAYASSRLPPAVSWIKIGFAGFLLFGFLAAFAIFLSNVGPNDLFAVNLLFSLLSGIGAAICALSIIGALLGIYLKKDRG